jgi:hypothetical protein
MDLSVAISFMPGMLRNHSLIETFAKI